MLKAFSFAGLIATNTANTISEPHSYMSEDLHRQDIRPAGSTKKIPVRIDQRGFFVLLFSLL